MMNKRSNVFEVNGFEKAEKAFLVAFYLLDFLYSWQILTQNPYAENFLFPFLVPLALFILKSRMFFISLLISFQISAAFLFLGAPVSIVKYSAAFFLAMLAFSKPENAFHLAIASIFFFFIPRIHNMDVIHVLLVFISFSLIVTLNKTKLNGYNRISIVNKLILALFVWTNISILWCPSATNAFFRYLDNISYFLVYWITLILVDDESKVVNTLWIFALGGVAMTFIGAVSILTPLSLNVDYLALKNPVSSLLTFSIFAQLALYYTRTMKLPSILVKIVILSTILYMFSLGSKGGILAIIISLITFFTLKNPNKTKRNSILLTAGTWIIALFLFAQILLVPLVYVKLSDKLYGKNFPTFLATLPFRLEQWRYAEKMIDTDGHFLTGVGMSGFAYLHYDAWEHKFVPRPFMISTHCMYVQIYVDYGIVGLAIFVFLTIAFFFILSKSIKRMTNESMRIYALTMYVGALAFLIHGLVDWSLSDERFWFYVGLGMALLFIDRYQRHHKKSQQVSEPVEPAQ